MTDDLSLQGEGDDGESHVVPPDLLELYEIQEWEKAVEEENSS